jgi:hypothetical protein
MYINNQYRYFVTSSAFFIPGSILNTTSAFSDNTREKDKIENQVKEFSDRSNLADSEGTTYNKAIIKFEACKTKEKMEEVKEE